MTEGSKRVQGRPRSPENDRAILSAVKTMLAEEGFEALRFDALARVSGVSHRLKRNWFHGARGTRALAIRVRFVKTSPSRAEAPEPEKRWRPAALALAPWPANEQKPRQAGL